MTFGLVAGIRIKFDIEPTARFLIFNFRRLAKKINKPLENISNTGTRFGDVPGTAHLAR